ncbi:MAG: hypothetical protein AAFO07_28705, partial [Bacteroidota bacterium]
TFQKSLANGFGIKKTNKQDKTFFNGQHAPFFPKGIHHAGGIPFRVRAWEGKYMTISFLSCTQQRLD